MIENWICVYSICYSKWLYYNILRVGTLMWNIYVCVCVPWKLICSDIRSSKILNRYWLCVTWRLNCNIPEKLKNSEDNSCLCVCPLQWHKKLKNSEQVPVMHVLLKLTCIALKSSPNITMIFQASLETDNCLTCWLDIFALQDHDRSPSLWCKVMVSWLINSNGEHIQSSSSLSATLRFSLWCCWRYRYSGMWCYITGWVVPNIFKNSTTFIFRVKWSKKTG